MPCLFDPLTLRGVTISNRILVSPMCEYSSSDGFANDWHFVHLGSRAVGGAGVVLTEATAVTPEGRISPHDLGIWSDAHVEGLARCVRFIHAQGRHAGIQLAHAGRKGSTRRPWEPPGAVPAADGGWVPVAPTETPFADGFPIPRALAASEVAGVVTAFRDAARRGLDAGFDIVEIHAAHGYLIHEFLSPLVNTRSDAYGGAFDHRARLCLEVLDAVRSVWPDRQPVFVRLSCTDWVPGGWTIDDSVVLAQRLAALGADLIDCSSAGAVAKADIPVAPGYQVPFAERLRREAGVATGAVGLITTAAQADAIVASGQADCVLLAREMLRDPYFPLRAARELGRSIEWPAQYLRAAPPGSPVRQGV
jgi:2,4-dienoyl-CoA reductase-like NADH-dependent reductase (Old Yellow Enzyme family)